MRSTVMLSIVSGSLIDILVPSIVSSFGAELNGFSRFSSWISDPLWLGLFIYLFIRKFLPGMAKNFGILAGTTVRTDRRRKLDRALCSPARKRSDRGRRPFPVLPPTLASIKSAYCRVRQEKTKSNTGIYSDCTLDLL